MAVTKFYDPNTQYRLDSGAIAAGGTMYFFENDATTPKDVLDAPGGTNLGSSVDLDEAGRLESPVFVDGPYCAQLKDEFDVQVWFMENLGVSDIGGVTPLDPADGDPGSFYRTDGTDAYWDPDVIPVPDPAGHANQQLGTDGDAVFWEAKASYDETHLPGGIVDSASSYQIGLRLIQEGSDTAPTASAAYTTKSVTFPTAYAAAPKVYIEVTADNITPAGALVSHSTTAVSTTGFTVKFYAGQEHGSNDWFITTAVTFNWQASGRVAAS